MKRFLVCLTIITITLPHTFLAGGSVSLDNIPRRRTVLGQQFKHNLMNQLDQEVRYGVKDVLGKPNPQGRFVCNGMMVPVQFANHDEDGKYFFIVKPVCSGLPWQKKGAIIISRQPSLCQSTTNPDGTVYIHSYEPSLPIYSMKARIAASTLKNSCGLTYTINQLIHIPIGLGITGVALLQKNWTRGLAAAAVGIVAGVYAYDLVFNTLDRRHREASLSQALNATSNEDLREFLEHGHQFYNNAFVQRAQKLLNQRNRCLESSERKVLWRLPKALQDHALTFLRKKN